MEDKQTIGTEYEPWIQTDIITKEGSLGGIAKSMKDLMESAPAKSKIPIPTGSAGLGYAKGFDPMVGGAYTSPGGGVTGTIRGVR
jgi:hypothetical protein